MSESRPVQHPDLLTLDVYLDRELPPEEVLEIEAHLAGCRSCRESIEARRAFFELIRESEQVSLSKDLSADVLDALQRTRMRLLTGVLGTELILAAVLLLLFGPRVLARLTVISTQIDISRSLLWLVDRVASLGDQIGAGLAAIGQTFLSIPLPGLSGLPAAQLTWLHLSGILAGTTVVWLILNRVLIGNSGLERSRFS